MLKVEEDVMQPKENIGIDTVVVVSVFDVKHDDRKTLFRDEKFVDAEIDGLTSIVIDSNHSFLPCSRKIVRSDFHLTQDGGELVVD